MSAVLTPPAATADTQTTSEMTRNVSCFEKGFTDRMLTQSEKATCQLDPPCVAP